MLVNKFVVGFGQDVHRFSAVEQSELHENYIVVSGVKIPYTKKLVAYSDGDVVFHALVDAIFGALGLGDIGEVFSNKDDKWKNANSEVFLQYAYEKLCLYHAVVSNIDISILLERPYLTTYKLQMKTNIASLLKIEPTVVNIKAGTTENLGFIGREEGIMALAIISLVLDT